VDANANVVDMRKSVTVSEFYRTRRSEPFAAA